MPVEVKYIRIYTGFIIFTKFQKKIKMEYSVIEGKKLNSNNYECQGFLYVKSREHGDSIYLKCALFRIKSCTCTGKINKQTNLLQLTSPHCHDPGANYSGKIIITNTIKHKAENSTTNLRELFNECCMRIRCSIISNIQKFGEQHV